MIVFLPIENKTREFFPKLFLAYFILKNSNHEVIIGGQRFINYRIKNFENCLWFDKHTFFERLKKKGIHLKNKIVVLDEEGPISIHDKYTKYLYQKDFTNLLDYIMLWGSKDRSFIHKSDQKKTLITGHPKYDLVKKSEEIFKKEILYIKKKYKKFIFIPGHYSLTDNTKAIERFNKALLKKYKNKDKITNKKMFDNELEAKNYVEFLKLIIQLAEQNPKLTFIFRRHPLEDQSLLNELFKNKPQNLKLVYKFVITPWISSCDYFLHAGCTSVFEAVTARKKIILFNLKKISKLNRFKSLKLSNWNFDDQEKMISFFKNIKKYDKDYIINKNVNLIIKNIYESKSFQSEFLSLIGRIKFKKVSKIYYKSKEQDKTKIIFSSLKMRLREVLSYLKNSIILKSFLVNFIPEKHLYGKKMGFLKFKSIEKKEIKAFFAKISNNNRKSDNFKILKISESVFHLQK